MDGTPIRSDDKALHGRTKELKSVGHVLDAVNARHEGMLWLEGQVGIGKSRLLAAAEDRALQQGFRVARIPTPEQLGPGLDPTLEIWAKDRSDVRPDRDLIAPDQVADWLEQAPPTSMEDASRRSILTIDDAQWADAETVEVLASVQACLAGQPIGWIMSSRKAPPEPGIDELLGEWEERGAERLSVEPLPDDVADELIGDVLGAPPDEALRQLAVGTAGNPQLLRALLGGLRDEKSIAVSGGQARLQCEDLPARARAVMHCWVLEVSALARHLLDAASAFDRTFSRGELSDLLGRPAEQLEPLLRELVDAGLVVESADDLLGFRHELVRRWASDPVPTDGPCALRDGWIRAHPREGAGSSARHTARRSVGRDTRRVGRIDRLSRDHARSGLRERAWDRLTDSERTVATLVARGLTNREAAEEIYISPHTVSFHLRKIYRKFGIRSRVELTRLLVEQEQPYCGVPTLTLDPTILPAVRPTMALRSINRGAVACAAASPPVMVYAGDASTHHGRRSPAVEQTGAGERPSFGWASLTAAELRVARLAATGLTNRAIADEFELSPHTVESHLRHAFHKLDVRSRVELTRVVLAHGS